MEDPVAVTGEDDDLEGDAEGMEEVELDPLVGL